MQFLTIIWIKITIKTKGLQFGNKVNIHVLVRYVNPLTGKTDSFSIKARAS